MTELCCFTVGFFFVCFCWLLLNTLQLILCLHLVVGVPFIVLMCSSALCKICEMTQMFRITLKLALYEVPSCVSRCEWNIQATQPLSRSCRRNDHPTGHLVQKCTFPMKCRQPERVCCQFTFKGELCPAKAAAMHALFYWNALAHQTKRGSKVFSVAILLINTLTTL